MNRVALIGAAMALFAWAGAGVAQQPAKGDPAKGQKIATQVCAACHMGDGNSDQAVNPKLAGQHPEYTARQLAHFKSQGGKKPQRENAIMAGMAAALSDADARDLAAYYAGQKLKPAAARDKDLAAAGQKLWRGGNLATGVPACSGCHGPAGAGIPAQYPRLAGQFPEYVEAQLKAFRSGTRANDGNGMMRGVTARMTDQEIKAVAEYAAGLR